MRFRKLGQSKSLILRRDYATISNVMTTIREHCSVDRTMLFALHVGLVGASDSFRRRCCEGVGRQAKLRFGSAADVLPGGRLQ